MKNILITGGTSGIGLEAAVVLAKAGDQVTIVGRDPGRTATALAEIQKRSGNAAVASMLCDFSSQDAIRAFAAEYRAKHSKIDVLVNNAGMVSPKRVLTKDGIESTFATNHLGYFLLTHLLLDLVVAAAPARIVNVSSIAHKRGTIDFDDLGFEKGGYGIMKAYERSKLANVMFTRELSRRLQGKNVLVNCLHPGAVATGIWAKAPGWTQPILKVLSSLFMLTPEQGGQTITYLAASPEVEGKTGLYFEKNTPKTPGGIGTDDAIAAKLWDASAKLVKVSA